MRIHRLITSLGALFAVSLFSLNIAESSSPQPFPKPGEWPCYRRTGTMEAHSPAKGNITQPCIVWKQFVGSLETQLLVEPAEQSAELALPRDELRGGTIDLSARRWGASAALGNQESELAQREPSPQVTYADVLPNEPGDEKLEFESAFSKPTVNGQWQHCVGRCFYRRDGKWVQAWETKTIRELFQPLPLVGDFDDDGKPDVAILPFKELMILDARTGEVKDRCAFTDGRSYGFFGVYDFDGDGKSEFLVQADFAKHVDVLGYHEGKLKLLWRRPIELDISNPQKILRVGPNPVADVDGDGRVEVIVNAFNDTGDQRWHITIHDSLSGVVKADLADAYFDAALDVDGDGTAELLTTRVAGAGLPAFGTICVRSFRGGQSKILWQRENAGWQTWEPPLPSHVQSTATFGRKTMLSRRNGARARVVVREKWSRRSAPMALSLVEWDTSSFRFKTIVTGANLEALGLDDQGSLIVRCSHAPDATSKISVQHGRATIVSTRPHGVATATAAVVWPEKAKQPTIVVQGAGEELIAFHPPNEGQENIGLKRVPGRGQATQWPAAFGPVLADLAGDGRRQIVLATAAPNGCARLAARDLAGPEVWHHDFERIPGSPPVWNTGGIILWRVGRFTDRRKQDVLVTIRRSMMHSEETVLLSGRDGRQLWRRDRQISQRGVGGGHFAIADYDGDGLDDAASLHPSILYLLRGATGRDILAKDATWDAVPAKPVYWGQPVAGKFTSDGNVAIYFGGRSMTGLVRADGTLAWWDALDHSATELPAFGDFDGDGQRDAIAIGYEDGIRCYEVATGKIKWRMLQPSHQTPAGSASADLNGDGRDEALFVLGQTLFCLSASADGKGGVLLWKLDLPSQTGPPSLTALDASGRLSILLVGAEGYVYCVR